MGLINIFNSVSNEHSKIEACGKIKDVLPDYDFTKAIIIKAGEKLTPEYEIKKDDVLYVRTVPGSATAVAVTLAVVAIVAAGVSVGVALYQDHAAKEAMEKAQRDADNLANAVNKLPFLRGANNRRALGNAIQFVVGRTYNSGYSLTSGFYSIGGTDGSKQYWNAVLSAGYKGQVFEKLYSGNEIIQEWNDTTPQSDVYGTLPGSLYHDEENIIEISQNGIFKNNYFRNKVVGTLVGSEIKNDFDETPDSKKEYIEKQCENNTYKIEVCIEFSSLRSYNTETETWQERAVTVTPEWSNGEKDSSGNIIWHTDGLKFESSTIARWETADTDKIESLISEGKIESKSVSTPAGTHYYLVSKSDDVKVITNIDGSIEIKYLANQEFENTIQRNSNHTIRFVASKEFTAAECYGKNITVRLSRSMKAQSNTQEDCYFLYMNCYCYDSKKSTSSKIEPALVFENPEKLAMLGLRFISNENTKDLLKEFNAITYAVAPNINSNGTVTDEVPNRNPVSWIYKIMTSETHRHSRINPDEIDISNFYLAWKHCEDNGLYIDGIITNPIRKRDLLTKILSVINGTLYINTSTGLYEIAIDKAEDTPVAMLNAENIAGITYAKDLSRKPTGIKMTFTNNENWEIDTRYVMLDGSQNHTVDDLIIEKNVELVTDSDFIYKIGQRTMREQVLQPMTITADIGREGDFYPLYSLVLLQVPQFRQGIASSTITSLIQDNAGRVTGINIQDEVILGTTENYGVEIEIVTPTDKVIVSRQVIGDDKTRTLMFKEPISGAVLPAIGNIVSFGLMEKVTAKYKIYGISRNNNNGIKLTLKPYNPALYEFGTIPEFKSNLTPAVNKGGQVPTVTQTQLQQVVDNVRTVSQIINFYCLSTNGTVAPAKNLFSTNVPIMTPEVRFLWSYTKYYYKDGSTKDTNIVLSGAYGEQGAPGSGYRLDLTPDSTTVFANSNGAASVPSVQFGAYLFLDTQELTSQTTFKAYINDNEVGSWNGSIVTIPTINLTSDTTQIKIVAKFQSVERMAFCSVTKVYGNTIYQLLPSSQNIKVQNDGSVVPELVTITRQKITNTGYYQASEDEGVIYGRVIPGGELQKIGYYEVQQADLYDSEKQYCSQFEPFLLGVDTDTESGEDIVIGDEEGNALIFFTRKEL